MVSPIVAAMAAGSLLWAASNNPLATAGEATPAPPVTVVQSAPGPMEVAVTTVDQPSLAQLRKKADRLAKAVKQARKESRAAREAGVVSAAGGSTWVPSAPASGGSGSGGSGSGGSGGGSAVQPAPAPAPEPPPADTWTGSSGG